MAEERWLPVAGFEGYYEVSDQGRVRSVDRVVKCRGRGMRNLPGKVRPTQKRPNGYLFVALSRDGIKKQLSVHRLVASAFVPNPNELPMVNHIDEDKTNNACSNLEWCDAEYNANYGTGKNRSSDTRAIPVVAVSDLGKVLARFRCAADAERMTGIHRSDISACLHGRIKTAGGYRWAYAD